jgi:hypothetical protein
MNMQAVQAQTVNIDTFDKVELLRCWYPYQQHITPFTPLPVFLPTSHYIQFFTAGLMKTADLKENLRLSFSL